MGLFRGRKSYSGLTLAQVTVRPDRTVRPPGVVAAWSGVVGRVTSDTRVCGEVWVEVLPGWRHPGYPPGWFRLGEVDPVT